MEFIRENLETLMMVAFIAATAFGIYKVYVMFEKQEHDGIDIQTLEEEIIEIIKSLLREQELSQDELFFKIQQHENFDGERYRNFNLNRYRQILERLHIEHRTDDFEALKEKLC